MAVIEKMLDFIDRSPSCYHAVENIEKELEAAGFVRLAENRKWELAYGGKYYVSRNGSSVIAFAIPQGEMKGFHMIASHSDSPCFKIKENPEMTVEGHYVKLNVEKYGGMILSTWLDRPLSVAGRVVTAGKEAGIAESTVAVNRDLLIIPNVAIHMNREMNKGVEYNVQTDMLPLYAMEKEGNTLQELIAREAGIDAEEILGSDLFLYNREKGRVFGADGEFICAPRLDDLECVYASLQAMLHGRPKNYVNFMIVFDNEEVGSTTKQGAASTFLRDTQKRICEALGMAEGDYYRLLAGSFMISADNAHGVHPNHPEKADPTNRPYLNGGIVIKYHGSQKYTTDGVSTAIMKSICRRAGVPWQTYANRSDIAGGSTLGNLSAAQVPVDSVDIGLPQLAMHSAYETAGVKDVEYMIRAMECFYEE
ncbi:MAG: M18 family aminopeptidase [Lachnospiraceae bacterium]|jgi:aspartyl aminopeptidase|nr:M18 family aminopeptidase [Lachnospiraceae bacterium]